MTVWPFKRKKRAEEKPEPAPCRHKWQDFPWIMRFYYNYGEGTLRVEVVEPYVCIYCKERQDRLLIRDWYNEISGEQIDRLIQEYKEKYKEHCEHEAVIEDKINDFQLVDREWLEFADLLRRSRT